MVTRDEHLEWCKQRAREYLDRGDLTNAVVSMLSDLAEHPETKKVGDKMGMVGLFAASQSDPREVRRFIEGFR